MGRWSIAQQGELSWHIANPHWRADNLSFISETKTLFDKFGFSKDYCKDKLVLDVGAGPRLRTKYFRGADLYAIEPLGNEFIAEFDWCDLEDCELNTNQIEELIPEFVDKFDLIISINALDHCENFSLALTNMASYLKRDGEMFISYDLHDGLHYMHPLSLTKESSEEVFSRLQLIVHRTIEHVVYGLGEKSISYLLGKK